MWHRHSLTALSPKRVKVEKLSDEYIGSCCISRWNASIKLLYMILKIWIDCREQNWRWRPFLPPPPALPPQKNHQELIETFASPALHGHSKKKWRFVQSDIFFWSMTIHLSFIASLPFPPTFPSFPQVSERMSMNSSGVRVKQRMDRQMVADEHYAKRNEYACGERIMRYLSELTQWGSFFSE